MLLALLLLALLPTGAWLVIVISATVRTKSSGRSCGLSDSLKGSSCARHAQGVGARWCGNTNGIGIILGTALNAISRRQKRVESLNQGRVTVEESRHPLNHARGINPNTDQTKAAEESTNKKLTLDS